MPSLIKHISTAEKKRLFEYLNYLNMEEFRSFCDKHKIPYTIYYESTNGLLKKTGDKDRKGIVLARIKKYLNTGKASKPTIIQKKIVCFQPLKNPKKTDRLNFGQYDWKNKKFFDLMKSMTENKFKDGALARKVIRQFWSEGKAPTLRQYAKAWLKENDSHTDPLPEWAFLTDKKKGISMKNWKSVRIHKARLAIKMLNTVKRANFSGNLNKNSPDSD
jgi:hypothetical protein